VANVQGNGIAHTAEHNTRKYIAWVHACEIYVRKITLTLNLQTTTIIAQPFNVIKWQLKFNPVA